MSRDDAFDGLPDDLEPTARWLTARLDAVADSLQPQRPPIESAVSRNRSHSRRTALAVAAVIVVVLAGLGATVVARRDAPRDVGVVSVGGTVPDTGTTIRSDTACPGERATNQSLSFDEADATATSELAAVAAFATAHGFAPESFERRALPDHFEGIVRVVTADTVPAAGSPPGTSTSRDVSDEIPWYVHRSAGDSDLAIWPTPYPGGRWVVYTAVGCPAAVAALGVGSSATSPSGSAPSIAVASTTTTSTTDPLPTSAPSIAIPGNSVTTFDPKSRATIEEFTVPSGMVCGDAPDMRIHVTYQVSQAKEVRFRLNGNELAATVPTSGTIDLDAPCTIGTPMLTLYATDNQGRATSQSHVVHVFPPAG